MDFATLKTRLQAIIGRAPADVCYELVTADINQELRLRDMESQVTLTAALSISLPADFLSAVYVYEDTTPLRALKQTEPTAMQRLRLDGTGRPSHYAIIDGAMLLDQIEGTTDIILRYHAKLADLSADSDTNDVLTNYPAVYIYGTLAHHAALRGDDRGVATWYAAYEKAKKQARADDNKKGGPPPSVIARNVA